MKAGMTLVGLAAVAFLAGCATPLPPGAEPGPDHTMAYDVLIEATDPGARIQANGQDVGPAPVHIKIFGDPDGTFHDFGSFYYIVQALPIATNQFPQAHYFRTGHLMMGEDHIPRRILFDMNRPPAQPVAPYGSPAYGYPHPYYYGAPYYYGPQFDFYVGPRYRR
jgi:hypothetical protein